jgi:hypothetical protein
MNNIHIGFSYNSNHKLELETNPSSLVPERTSQSKIPFLPGFCTFKYKFKYTIAAPIVTKIKDDNSPGFSKEGYEFYFPMKLYICNDNERTCEEQLAYELDLELIEELTGEKLYNCQAVETQRTITVSDSSGNLLGESDITHYCNGYANNCWLGRTNSKGKATINIPKCDNSTLEVVKEGYQTALGEIQSSYTLGQLKDFEVDAKIINAKEFAAAHYITNGFTQSSCGKSPETLLEQSIYDPLEKDELLFSITGANDIFVSYPTTETIKIAGGNYKVNSIVNSEVKIQPSYYAGEYVSFNTEDNTKAYEGDWLLGAAEHEFVISSSDLTNKDKVTFYALVEQLSTAELEVEDFAKPVITSDGLVGETQADTDCDGLDEIITIDIPKSEYINFIKPKFTKKII